MADRCLMLCGTSSECPSKAFRCTNAVCVAIDDPECSQNADCAPRGNRCVEGLCTCNGETMCATDQVCDLSGCGCGPSALLCGSECIPDAECCDGPDCANGKTCQFNLCLCPAATRECFATCIPVDDCCTNSECDLPAVCRAGTCSCPGEQTTEVTCNDLNDNDCDGLTDCHDPDCDTVSCGLYGRECNAASGACECPNGTVESACFDTADNDCDGLIDCDDGDCQANEPTCVCTPTEAGGEVTCGDGVDNDCDDATDCGDSDCANLSCAAVQCGDWGTCGGFSDVCAETGVQERTCQASVCTIVGCELTETVETQECSRVTDGHVCSEFCGRCASGVCEDDSCGAGKICCDCTNACLVGYKCAQICGY